MPTAGALPDGDWLAREMRQALDELGAAVEDGHDLANTVEDAFGFEYQEGERPSAAEQGRARTALPAALNAILEVEARLREQLGKLAGARSRLASMIPAKPPGTDSAGDGGRRLRILLRRKGLWSRSLERRRPAKGEEGSSAYKEAEAQLRKIELEIAGLTKK